MRRWPRRCCATCDRTDPPRRRSSPAGSPMAPSASAGAFAALGERVVEVRLEGARAWLAADDQEPSKAEGGVRLLPYFDSYSVGCYPRDRLYPGRAHERALSRGQAGNVPVMLIGGVVAGVWHQRLTG